MRMVWRPGMEDFVEVPYGRQPRRSTGPILLGDYEAYDCPVTGKMIEGRYAHNENLKRQGAASWSPVRAGTRSSGKRKRSSIPCARRSISGTDPAGATDSTRKT